MTFRVERAEEGARLILKLSGRIEKENVDDIEGVFEALRGNHRDVVLDLEEVKLVDQVVVRFLARCEAEGGRLRNCPPYIRQWIAQENRRKS
jgi:anti-anti-sigma regulatory factor